MTFNYYLWLQNSYQLYGLKKTRKKPTKITNKKNNSISIVLKIRQTSIILPKAMCYKSVI